MSELREIFAEMKTRRRGYREFCRVRDTKRLDELGVDYRVYNNGQHLKVMHPDEAEEVDFWPSSGKWRGKLVHGRGLNSLLKYLCLGGEDE